MVWFAEMEITPYIWSCLLVLVRDFWYIAYHAISYLKQSIVQPVIGSVWHSLNTTTFKQNKKHLKPPGWKCSRETCLARPPYWPWKYCLSRQVVFGDRLNYIKMYDLLRGRCGRLRQLVSHSSDILRPVSLSLKESEVILKMPKSVLFMTKLNAALT